MSTYCSGNTYANYSIGGVEVTNSCYERDLGLAIDESIDYNGQYAKVDSSATKIMSIINRTYICKGKDSILNLYKSLVRLHLVNSCQSWRQCRQKDMGSIGKVQQHMTKMIPELSRLNHNERLC